MFFMGLCVLFSHPIQADSDNTCIDNYSLANIAATKTFKYNFGLADNHLTLVNSDRPLEGSVAPPSKERLLDWDLVRVIVANLKTISDHTENLGPYVEQYLEGSSGRKNPTLNHLSRLDHIDLLIPSILSKVSYICRAFVYGGTSTDDKPLTNIQLENLKFATSGNLGEKTRAAKQCIDRCYRDLRDLVLTSFEPEN